MTYGEFEGGDTYAQRGPALRALVAADPEWLDAYDTRKVHADACRIPLANRKRMMHW
jgi:hypothetical protein